MSYLTQLSLQNFRSYTHNRLDALQSGLIVLWGENGAGKTNILEAISLLSPGRGLRGAKAIEMQHNGMSAPWGVSAQVHNQGVDAKLGTGFNPQNGRRHVRINGADAKSQNAMLDYISCLWLTPQMDRLFIEGASARRKFLDRLIFTFDAGHSGRVTRYENALRQRSKLLQGEEPAEAVWLDSLEAQMAETAVAIAAARIDFINRLQKFSDVADDAEQHFFPKAHLSAHGTIEELLQNTPALEVEKLHAYQLKESRNQDAIKGGATTGVHKSDMAVTYALKNMPAGQCSTGEQKALLIGLILAHGRMMRAERGMPPVLLLDEIAAHLDEDRRAALFERLIAMGGQVWMTGTDPVLFDAIKDKAQFFHITNAQIEQRKTA
jgi:DNA replication and repair protein RecF